MRAIFHADREWGIGRGNALMFSIPQDMKFFRETTKGKVVVMGLNTLLSFPNGKPLKNRVNIVLCPDDVPEDVITVHSPQELFEEVKKCNVILKGPMVTPRASDPWPNLISANSMLRRSLDLYAAVRPIKIPEKGIDWTFFRENIEGEYIWGNKGIQVNEDLAVDFKVQTKQGSERIARAAFEFARKNGKKNVTVVTKANIVKLADGNFIKAVRKVGEEYPEIEIQERLVDAMAAKMMDPEFSKGIEVIVLPNLYGDIITDVAAEQQGGLGTASSSNLGDHYAMFEAIHGTAPYLMSHGRGEYADPSSLIRAVGMMLGHIGYVDRKETLEKAMDICTVQERKVVITTMPEDASTEQFTDYVIETIEKL